MTHSASPRPSVFCWFAPACFALIFGGVGLASAFTSPTEIDNRDAVGLTAPDLDGLTSGEWFDDTNVALSDRLWIRDRAISVNAEFEYRAFSDSTNPRVLVGTDGWLFLADTFTELCNSERAGVLPSPTLVVDALDELDVALGSDTDLVVAAVPEKAYLQPEFLPSAVPDQACGARLYSDLVDHLRPDPRFVDLSTILTEMKQADSATPLYRPLDTHWTPSTRAEMVHVLVDRWADDVWDPAAVAPLDDAEIEGGDLSGLLGYWPGSEITPVWILRFDVTTMAVSDGPVTQWRTEPDPGAQVVEGNTAIISDSHFHGLRAMLAPWFEDLVIVNVNDVFGNDEALGHIREADRLFLSFTGRSAAVDHGSRRQLSDPRTRSVTSRNRARHARLSAR